MSVGIPMMKRKIPIPQDYPNILRCQKKGCTKIGTLLHKKNKIFMCSYCVEMHTTLGDFKKDDFRPPTDYQMNKTLEGLSGMPKSVKSVQYDKDELVDQCQ